MKKIHFLLLLFAGTVKVHSQTIVPGAINNTGNSTSASGLILEWSVGESAITTLSNGNILTQGLLQPMAAIVNAPLPVKWLYFKATLVNGQTVLEWKTAQEMNNEYFDVERSFNGIQFSFLKKLNGNGNSVQPQVYNTTDPSPFNDITYYRLKQVDVNGAFSYSAIVSVKKASVNNYKFFPNPVSDILNVERGNANRQSIIELYDVSGKLIRKYSFNQGEAGNSLNVQGLSKGAYFIKITEEKDQWIHLFIKQ